MFHIKKLLKTKLFFKKVPPVLFPQVLQFQDYDNKKTTEIKF